MPGVTRREQLQADLSLLFITAIWGTTFVIVKAGVAELPPLTFIALRFWLAFAILLALFGRRLLKMNRRLALAGASIGFFLFAGFACQTAGLQFTTASKSGFITGLSVIFVPFLAWILIGHPPGRNSVIGVILATIGLGMLSLQNGLAIGLGDLLTLASCIGFALQIVLIAKYSPDHDPMALTTIQIGVVAILSTASAFFVEGVPTVIPPTSLLAAIFTGVIATALVFAIQNKAQAYTTPTRTALIFVLEPVFAAVFAYVWAGETFTERVLIGGLLIVIGMIVAELHFGPRLAENLET